MKILCLLRHGKSSWDDDTLADRDRPLAKRGRRDVPMMAERLQSLGVRPSLIVASSAKRTWQTAQLVADAIGYPREFMHAEDDLYLADPGTIGRLVAEQDDGFNVILLCGHNPGVTAYANRLIAGVTDNMPTAACLVVSSPAKKWSEFDASGCQLVSYDTPRAVRG